MMVRDASGVLRTVTSITVRDAGNVLRTVATISARDASGALRTAFSSAGAAAGALSPSYVQGSGYSKAMISVSTDPATVNAPSGATVVWNFADSGWAAINPSAVTTGFRKSVSAGQEAETTVTCSVTSSGKTTITNAITAHVENTYGGNN